MVHTLQYGRSVGQSVGRSIGRWFGRPVGQSVSVGRSLSRLVGQSVGHSDGRSVSQPVGWSIGRSINRSVRPSGGRSVSQQVDRPITWNESTREETQLGGMSMHQTCKRKRSADGRQNLFCSRNSHPLTPHFNVEPSCRKACMQNHFFMIFFRDRVQH